MVIVPGIDVSLLLRLLGIIYIYSSIQAIIIIGFDDCNIIVLSQKKKRKENRTSLNPKSYIDRSFLCSNYILSRNMCRESHVSQASQCLVWSVLRRIDIVDGLGIQASLKQRHAHTKVVEST